MAVSQSFEQGGLVHLTRNVWSNMNTSEKILRGLE